MQRTAATRWKAPSTRPSTGTTTHLALAPMPTLAPEQAAVEGRTLPSHLAGLGVPLTVKISTMSRPWASLPTTTNFQVRQLLDLRPAGRMPGPAPSPAAAQVRLKKPRKVEAPAAR